jgi:archaeosine synthase beta-subunit
MPPPSIRYFNRREVRASRGEKAKVDPRRPVAMWDELEIAAKGQTVPTRVLLLTGSECRFTCTMCDLWRHTLDRATQSGDLVEQIRFGLEKPITLNPMPLPERLTTEAPWIKLYNSSNFFDNYNVPKDDLPSIAAQLHRFGRIIVENHPRILNDAICRFRDLLEGQLEIAMGLETCQPEMLHWLNKSMTLADFERAVKALQDWRIDMRVFILFGLPGQTIAESQSSCVETIRYADRLGIRHCSVIPLRTQAGVLQQLASDKRVQQITAADLEHLLAEVSGTTNTLVTVDLWDWEKISGHCAICQHARKQRLETICIHQQTLPPVATACHCQA